MTAQTQTRTITEADYASLPSPLDAGRDTDIQGLSSSRGPDPAKVFALAEMLQASGYGHASDLDQLRETHDAVTQATATAYQNANNPKADLATLQPEDAVRRVREAAIDRMLTQGPFAYLADAATAFEDNLRPVARTAFRTFADTAVTAMRPGFDEALKTVTDAHKAGLTPDLTAGFIASDGTPKQVAAYRALGSAVATLDQLAGLRIRIHNTLARPSLATDARVMACFLTAADEDTCERAAGTFTGRLERVLVTNTHPAAGPSVRQAPRHRLGGAWLSLIAAGHTLRLNTPTDVDTLLDEN